MSFCRDGDHRQLGEEKANFTYTSAPQPIIEEVWAGTEVEATGRQNRGRILVRTKFKLRSLALKPQLTYLLCDILGSLLKPKYPALLLK